jgi:endonuclease/exonuclease/phosphatase family metal-dependent hydrolase
MSLRVLTLNTHKGFAFLGRRFVLSELREAVRAVGADLVFLQEVQGFHAGNSAAIVDWPEAPHYEYLADALWPEFAYGRNAVYPHGHHGNAVLSKFPIVAYENRDVSIDGHETRGLLHCTLRLPAHASDLHAICVHLGLKESHRRRQLALLSEVIRDHVPAAAPLIVAGDFNDWAAQANRILEESAGLREVFVHSNGRSARTFPAGFPLLQLDRIYVRNARVHAPLPLPRRPWSRLSDHAPLAAEVGL